MKNVFQEKIETNSCGRRRLLVELDVKFAGREENYSPKSIGNSWNSRFFHLLAHQKTTHCTRFLFIVYHKSTLYNKVSSRLSVVKIIFKRWHALDFNFSRQEKTNLPRMSRYSPLYFNSIPFPFLADTKLNLHGVNCCQMNKKL